MCPKILRRCEAQYIEVAQGRLAMLPSLISGQPRCNDLDAEPQWNFRRAMMHF